MSRINVVPTAAPAQAQAQADVSSTSSSSTPLKKYENDPSTLNIAPGVQLTDLQRKHVALVLDLFQGHGTMAKILDGFSEDSAYEDPVALSKNREEVAGQMLHIPTVTTSTETKSYQVTSVTPSVTTKTGSGKPIQADEIAVDFVHKLNFFAGLHYTLDTTLIIYSCADVPGTGEGGKIVRFQDRPDDRMPGNGLLDFFRKLNGVYTPKIAGIPKDEQEDKELAKGQH